MKLLNIGLKIIITGILVYTVAVDHDYSFYTLLRWIVCTVSIYFTYKYYEDGKVPLCIMFTAIAMLFNPGYKIWMERGTWQITDCIVAGLFILSIIPDLLQTNKSK